MKTKTIAMIMAVAMMVVCLVSGTLAWLTNSTGTITNTFTTSDITVTLEETKGEANGDKGKKFKMIPGYTIEKDPKATVTTGSEECWLFVKLEKSDNFDTYLEYSMADGWELVEGQTNVYARKVLSSEIGKAFDVLKNNQVTVKDTVGKTEMQAANTTQPTLKVTAYASQLHKNSTEDFDAATAWANIK